MAKLPKLIQKYCNRCDSYAEFSVREAARNKKSSLSAIERRKERRGKIGNLGKFSKVPAKKVKKSKKPNLVIRCNKCSVARNFPRGRMVKFQLI